MLNPRWNNAEKTRIKTEDGLFIPAVEGNKDYDYLIANNIPIADYVEPEKSWIDKRHEEYGSWSKQLDMMYHGTWKDHVKAVKDANPKE